IWPGDFRVPILFSALLMCIASAMLIRTAKALRGDDSYVDAFFPLLMMHMGLGAWWWGMLMQFVLPTFLLCIVMSAWSTASIHINGFLATRKVLGIVLPMILLPLSGSNGLVISVTKETRSYIRKGVSAMAHQSVQVHSEALNKFSKFPQ